MRACVCICVFVCICVCVVPVVSEGRLRSFPLKGVFLVLPLLQLVGLLEAEDGESGAG